MISCSGMRTVAPSVFGMFSLSGEAKRGEDMSRQREDTCKQHSGSAQTAVSKGGETDRLRTYSSGMTAIESKGSKSERERSGEEATVSM